MHSNHGFWPWHEFGMFPGFFFLLCVVVVFLIGRSFGSKATSGNTSTHINKKNNQAPLEILKTRYAKGEIDQEEFERMKKNISD
jgi:putative membrane protein